MSKLPDTIRAINMLPEPEKREIYAQLIPQSLLPDYGISDLSDTNIFSMVYPSGSRAMELNLRQHATDRDPLLYINIADTFNGQILVLLVVVNDPESPRYNTDVDQIGNRTNFGTSSRNIPAELAAMENGLAPGQVRRGLRTFKRSVPVFEDFISRMGHNMFLIEPLAYHNAIVFERYGFNYSRGLQDMKEIHESFQAGGYLYHRLNGSSRFRNPDAWDSVRGRSWAIHDGILDHPYTGFQMYKRIGIDAGVSSAPGTHW